MAMMSGLPSSTITSADFASGGWFSAPHVADIHRAARAREATVESSVDSIESRHTSATFTSSNTSSNTEPVDGIIAPSHLKVDGGGDKIAIAIEPERERLNSVRADAANTVSRAHSTASNHSVKRLDVGTPPRDRVSKTKASGDKDSSIPRYSLFPPVPVQKKPTVGTSPPSTRTSPAHLQARRYVSNPVTASISSQGSEAASEPYEVSTNRDSAQCTTTPRSYPNTNLVHPAFRHRKPSARVSSRHPASPPIRPSSPLTPIFSAPTSTVFHPDTDVLQPHYTTPQSGSSIRSEPFDNMPTRSNWSTDSNDHSPHKHELPPPRRRTLGVISAAGIRQMLRTSTPLIDAARADDLPEVLRLLAPGGFRTHPASAADRDGYTALHWAAKLGHREVAHALLERAAHTEARTKSQDRTPLYLACQHNNLEVVALLLESGAAVNARSKMDGATALHRAAQAGHEGVLGLLLAAGADVNKRDIEGMPPLMWATQGKQLGAAKLLIAHGADLEARIKLGANLELSTREGQTVLLKAVHQGHHDFARLFLEGGAKPNAVGPNGMRSLHRAAMKGDLIMCQMLVECGADLSLRTEEGWTPLHCSARHGHRRVCRWLVEQGADANAVTNKGMDAIALAGLGGFVDVL